MKHRLIVSLIAIMLILLGLAVVASAELDNLSVAMELSSTKLAEPKEITVSIKVSNMGDKDMPGPITLYYPNNKQVEEFGAPTLTVGTSKSWSGTWKVTQKQLESGRITFKLKYSVYNDAGELINKTVNVAKEIEYTGAVTNVEINRSITPTTARKGQEVTITYDVINAGNVDITDVVIKEHKSIASKDGKIASVPAGEKASYSFTVTMGTKDLTSQATITYKASGKTTTDKKAAATIKYGEVKLSASLSADKKGAVVGDKVKLILTLKNSGTTDFQNITVTDPVLGEVFSKQSVAAGKTVTLEKEITISETADYQFTVTAEDAAGNQVDTATERLTLTAVDPSQSIMLTVNATSDRTNVYVLPGLVRFTVKVTNNSATDVSNVTVSASGVDLYTFPSILAGETREFTRDVNVSMAGKFRFDARVTNQLGERQVFESNIIKITRKQATAAPTSEPVITPAPPVHERIPTSDGLPDYVTTLQNALGTAYNVFLVLGGICLALLLIGIVRRIQANVKSAKAQDHLERGTYRDYTQPAPKKSKKERKEPEATENDLVRRPIGEDKEEPAIPGEDAVAESTEDGDLMAETLRKLYPDAEGETEAEVTVEVEDEASTGTARRRRSQRGQE